MRADNISAVRTDIKERIEQYGKDLNRLTSKKERAIDRLNKELDDTREHLNFLLDLSKMSDLQLDIAEYILRDRK